MGSEKKWGWSIYTRVCIEARVRSEWKREHLFSMQYLPRTDFEVLLVTLINIRNKTLVPVLKSQDHLSLETLG